ncbi:MAG TPA: hypothetical protein VF595_08710 [Tepidisphaeraceae bacterium]|jgi:hypothetical protein
MDKTLLLSFGAMIGFALQATQAADGFGPFTDHADIGAPSTVGPGSAEADAGRGTVAVSGGGLNTWAKTDAFHFVWRKVSGDVTLAADIEMAPAGAEADPHRKAFVMIRQSLEPDSPYADACVHGNGLTAIQWRDEKSAVTYETQAIANAPKRVRIEKHGQYLSMSFGATDADLKPAGGAAKIDITGDYYVGIGVCAHNTARVERATFSNIVLNAVKDLPAATRESSIVSTLETIQLASKDRRAVYVVRQPRLQRIEAPNWSTDGLLYFNNGGRLFKIKADTAAATPPDVSGGQPQPVEINLGVCTNINNDHALSPDGKWMAISDQSQGDRRSTIYVVPSEGGTPRKVTQTNPSYFHGWSPDGKILTYCGERNGQFDIYTIPVEGGPETRLTASAGKNDGPEYSPDGQYIYFNSDRTGSMQIWRMKADGLEQEQVTKDDLNNWFPHLSPDGQQMVFLTYEKGVDGHPENKDVMLKVMNLRTGGTSVLAKLFGGQGTINVPSWSPDGKYLAFVSYQIVP